MSSEPSSQLTTALSSPLLEGWKKPSEPLWIFFPSKYHLICAAEVLFHTIIGILLSELKLPSSFRSTFFRLIYGQPDDFLAVVNDTEAFLPTLPPSLVKAIRQE